MIGKTLTERLAGNAILMGINLSGPALIMRKGDQNAFGGPGVCVANGIKFVIQSAVKAKYPSGMGRSEGKLWASLQEYLCDEETVGEITITVGQAKWLYDLLCDDSVKLDSALCQWREAIIDYLAPLLEALDK